MLSPMLLSPYQPSPVLPTSGIVKFLTKSGNQPARASRNGTAARTRPRSYRTVYYLR